MFKEIKATFKVVEDTAFKEGRWKEDRSYFQFEVKRVRSGATAYGDCSAHVLDLPNVKGTMPKLFDTRYEGISTVKEKWISFWKKYIEEEYELKVELESYQEAQEGD